MTGERTLLRVEAQGDRTSRPDVDAWEAWSPEELAARLDGLAAPWAIAAGWAIELFVRGDPRPHADVEIVVAADSFAAVRTTLPGLEWYVAGRLEGGEGRLWPFGEAPAGLHQTWGWDRRQGCWRVDVFREPWEGDMWVCRRNPAVRRPLAEAVERTADGIPYLSPEIALLFKAKHSHEEKNTTDLARTLPLLDAGRRRWLGDALRIVHPGHDWISLVEP